ncbi:P-loop NTPase fold protein [Streptomyces sp. NPDC093808]|uniref:P-loop NTPase fold protein n=1 Tax=Streptomyces sp. NPDC093808 TaxID=3154985 RepID=UPI00344E6C0E
MATRRPWTIEDIAIDRHDQDRFDHHAVAQQLTRTVTAATQSLAIGLLGPFGSGKSSVVRLLAGELAVNKRWAVLHVSAEHHSGVARARALMYALLDDAHQKGLISEDDYLSERACLEGSRQHTLPRPDRLSGLAGRPGPGKYINAGLTGLAWVAAMLTTLWLIGMAVVLAAHQLDFWADVPAATWFASKKASTVTTVLVSAAAISAVLAAGKEGALQTLRAYEITVTSPRPDSTDELEQAFVRLLRRIDRRLVIAVDDVDRLAASDVLEALTTIRSFLLTGHQHPKQPVFVLSCDEAIVREAISGVRPSLAHRPAGPAAGSGDTPPEERSPAVSRGTTDRNAAMEEAAQEYLNKLFTVRLVLPAPGKADLRDYAEELLLEGGQPHPGVADLGGAAVVRVLLDVLIHRGVHDPRHVIRLLNSFFTHYQLAQRREQPVAGRPPRIAPGEVTGHPIALARMTVLRHDYRDLFDAVCAENDLLALLDDVLLGIRQDLSDPLLAPYCTDTSDPQALDLDRHPGLRYLLATAARARLKRPSYIGPLITLGSDPASRLLGSEMATEIQQALIGRDGAAFAQRLNDPVNRPRVLDAAAAALDAARPGQDLDNALTASISALGECADLFVHAQAEERRALRSLTETIAHHRPEMTLPPPSHLLVPLLGLTDDAHLPRLLATLQQQPTDADEARSWAQAILKQPTGPHATALAGILDVYFTHLTDGGNDQDLTFWLGDEQQPLQADWPNSAFAALLTMAARSNDHSALRQASNIAIAHAGIHHWDRTLVLSLGACLSAEHPAPAEAIRILAHTTGPSDSWGPSSNSGDYDTLAGQIAAAVTDVCTEDTDVQSIQTCLELLKTWLPAVKGLTESASVTRRIAEAVAAVAADHADTALAAGDVLRELPEEDAAVCIRALATTFLDHRDVADATGVVLRDILVDYLHRFSDSPDDSVDEAEEDCAAALTQDLAAINAAGRFARETLPMALATPAGNNLASSLAASLITAVQPNQPVTFEELLPSLHVLLHDDTVRGTQLTQVIHRLQQVIAHGHPLPALTFVARYIADSALDANWLTWYAQHWTSLSGETRSLACTAAQRPDLPTALKDCLVQHLLSTEEAEPWHQAAALWPTATSEQRGSLLAAAHGRAPELAACADSADPEVLCAALVQAGDQIGDALLLVATATHGDQATADYVSYRMSQTEWKPALCDAAVAATTDVNALWDLLTAAMEEDFADVRRGVDLLNSLTTHHAESIPETLIQTLTLPLRGADEPLATAIGHALRGQQKIAKKLRDAMKGHSSTSDQRRRNAAFVQASGLA